MTIEEQRRKAFEQWCKRTRPVLSIQRGWKPGTLEKYQSEKTNMAWRVWNAALGSVVIELPDTYTAYGCMGGYSDDDGEEVFGAAEVREAIEAAGLKVNP